jgi:hypothetical protein
LKSRWRRWLGQIGQSVILTGAEKRIVAFILAAFFLGLTVKHYRHIHPHPVEPANTRNDPKAKASPGKSRHKTADFSAPTPSSSDAVED